MFLIFPYRIDRRFGMPWATIALIALNTLMFGMSAVLGLDWTIDTLGFRMDLWAPVTWLTASFLHADFFHILGNMYFLWLFASVIEDALGPWRVIGIYLAGGFFSAIAHGTMMLLFAPQALDIPAIGASGAIAAVMGLFAVRFYRTKIRVWYLFWFRSGTFAIASLAGVLLWFARDLFDGLVGLFLGSVGGVANWAHLGGLAFGIAFGLLSGQVRSASAEYLAEDAQGWAATAMHDIAAAKYSELAENDPSNPEWHRCKARELAQSTPPALAAASAEFAEAVRLYVTARKAPEALDAFIEAEQLVGTLTMPTAALLAVAAEAEKRAEWLLAERLYMDIIETHDGTSAAEKALFRLAHVYLGAGRQSQAATTWGAFYDLHPNSEWLAFADPALRATETA